MVQGLAQPGLARLLATCHRVTVEYGGRTYRAGDLYEVAMRGWVEAGVLLER